MRFNCGPTKAEITASLEQWHTWFAWFPVRVGSRDCRWLERVERRGTQYRQLPYGDYGWNFEYRSGGVS